MREVKKLPALDLYNSEGWVNIPALAALGCWCYVIVGKRQVGKTFGVLEHIISNGGHFLYLRRTKEEFETICSDPQFNPFIPLEKHDIKCDIEKVTSKTWAIGEYETGENGEHTITNKLGVGITLASFANLRGFNGSGFTDMYLDEFIPEQIVIQRKAEGDTLLNAYRTVSGNRELEGQPPLRLWLTANAFNIANPILRELGVIDIIAKLSETGREWTMTDTGVFIGMPISEKISAKQKNTAFMRHMAQVKDSKFYAMAMENKFSYNDLSQIRKMRTTAMHPVFQIGEVFVYQFSKDKYFATHERATIPERYKDDETGRAKFRHNYPLFRLLFGVGQVWANDIPTLIDLKNFLDIKV